MFASRKLIAVLLLVLLPALIAAKTTAQCKVSVSQKLTDTTSAYYTYQGKISNVGSLPVTSVTLAPSDVVESLSGLSGDSKYTHDDIIAVGNDYSFTYTVKKGSNVQWHATLSCSAASTSKREALSNICGGVDCGASSCCLTGSKGACYDPSQYTCSAGVLCPTGLQACGVACYYPSQYTCVSGILQQLGSPSVPTATAAPTSAPTATAAPTSAPTVPATSAPTSTPTSAATKAPTKAPTSAPTKAPTSAPTSVPTSSPATSTPSGGNGRRCPAGSWWAPAPQTTWQWQLTGSIDQSVNVQMYDIDLFDNTADTISSLHAAGRTVICYFSTQYENWRPDAASWSASILGNNLDDWAGEKYVDIRSPIVRSIMSSRLDLAVSKGCDGVEPDNVDGYQAKSGFPLTASDQISFNTFIANEAHARGLSVGLKNDLDQATALQSVFDWALNEQCSEYGECSSLNVFIQKGKAVFNTEYSGTASKVCPSMVTSKFSSLIKKLELDASITAQCCTYQTGGCAAVPHRCISSMS